LPFALDLASAVSRLSAAMKMKMENVFASLQFDNALSLDIMFGPSNCA
jgi:hypothetical protein